MTIFREQEPTIAVAAATNSSAIFSLLLPWDPMPACIKCDPTAVIDVNESLHNALMLTQRQEALKGSNEKNIFLANHPDLRYVLEQLSISSYPIQICTGARHSLIMIDMMQFLEITTGDFSQN